MNETAGVGVIALLVVAVLWMNYSEKEIKKEVEKAQKTVVMPSGPNGYPFPTGQVGWNEDVARAQEDYRRNFQERMRVVGQQIANEQARNFKPPQIPQAPGLPGWRP
jgi:hypothetical protein